MSYTPEIASNLFSPPPYSPRMVAIPNVRRQRSAFTTRVPQPGVDFPLHQSHIPYAFVKYPQYHTMQYTLTPSSHGNTINTINTALNSLKRETTIGKANLRDETQEKTDGKKSDGPLDLSSSNASNENDKTNEKNASNDTNSNTHTCTQSESENAFVFISPKREPPSPTMEIDVDELPSQEPEPVMRKSNKKRKSSDDEEWTPENFSGGSNVENSHHPSNKRQEVLKAARSLFSKRTRTLYHWLYPDTSKSKLKQTVSAAWDTLSTAEKDFYISQVLGRFGVPAGSLMVNPQLGGFASTGINSQLTLINTPEETRQAVNNLLLSEEDVNWSSGSRQGDVEPSSSTSSIRKRRRQTAKNSNGGENGRSHGDEDEETQILKQIRDETFEDEFADDPELSKEFEQFRTQAQGFLDDELCRINLNDILEGL